MKQTTQKFDTNEMFETIEHYETYYKQYYTNNIFFYLWTCLICGFYINYAKLC